MDDFRASRWQPGGYVQTIWSALFSCCFDGVALVFRCERWVMPDSDFVDVDWWGDDRAAPLLVLFHGLEGSSSSHYAQAFAVEAARRGWRYAVPHFRGCLVDNNTAPLDNKAGDLG